MAGTMNSRIKEALVQKGISQKGLSEMTGLTESTISHYVRGDRVPRGANLAKIANALGTTTDDLLREDRTANKENDLIYAKTLIARNASEMTTEEKMEFVRLLIDKEAPHETE